MSELLLTWLNEELQLSTFITNFENDFASGFLLGEILYRVNQQKNFSDFVRSDSADAKIINFCLLEPTMRSLSIKFDPISATNIMNQKHGSSAKLLYQIKMAVERLNRSANVSFRGHLPGRILPVHNMPLRASKPQYDKGKHSSFETSIRLYVKSISELKKERSKQKEKEETNKLLFKRNQNQDLELEHLRTQRKHQIKIDKEVYKATHEVDTEAWINSQQQKSIREQNDMLFKQKMARRKKVKELNANETSKIDMKTGIEEFEENLDFLIPFEPHPSKLFSEENKIADNDRIDCDMVENPNLFSDIKEKKIIKDSFSRKRISRRKKFLKKCWDDQFSSKDQNIIAHTQCQLMKNTSIEDDLNSKLEVISKYKAIAVDNRNFRDNQYKKLTENDKLKAFNRDGSIYSTIRRRFIDDIAAQKMKYSSHQLSKVTADHAESIEIVKDALSKVVNFAMEIAAIREEIQIAISPHYFLAYDLWNEYKCSFIYNNSTSGNFENNPSVLSYTMLRDYLARTEITELEDASVNTKDLLSQMESDANFSPLPIFFSIELRSNVVLGEIIKFIRLRVNPLCPSVSINESSNCLKIILLGYYFSGRQMQARYLAERYNLECLSVHSLLQKALHEDSECGKKAKLFLSTGKDIPSELYVDLILDAINNTDLEKGWILHDFPTDKKEVELLETALTGYTPYKNEPCSNDVASPILSSIPTNPKSCLDKKFSGINFLFYLDIDRIESYSRCMGRLINEIDGERYHILTNPPKENSLTRHHLKHERNKFVATENLSLISSSLDLSISEIENWYKTRFQNFFRINTAGLQVVQLNEVLSNHIDSKVEEKLVREEKIAAATSEKIEHENSKQEINVMNKEDIYSTITDIELREQKILKDIEQAEELKEKKEAITGLQNMSELLKERKANEVQKIERLEVTEQVAAKRNALDFPDSHIPIFHEQWEIIENEYMTRTNCFLETIRKEKKIFLKRIWNEQIDVSKFVRRFDEKQALLSTFQCEFNEILDDMRFEYSTKSELYTRVDEFHDKMLRILYNKQSEDAKLLVDIENDTMVQYFEDSLSFYYQGMMQVECDRYHASLLLIYDMFSVLLQLDKLEARVDFDQIFPPTKEKDIFLGEISSAPPCISEVFLDPEKRAQYLKILSKSGAPVESENLKDNNKKFPSLEKSLEVSLEFCNNYRTLLQTNFLANYSPPESKDCTDQAPTMNHEVLKKNYTKAINYEAKVIEKRLNYIFSIATNSCYELYSFRSKSLCFYKQTFNKYEEEEMRSVNGLINYFRIAIEKENSIPHSLNIEPHSAYRFPPLLHLTEDTDARINVSNRVLQKEQKEALPVVEYSHSIFFSALQLNKTAANLRDCAKLSLGTLNVIPIFLFGKILVRMTTISNQLPMEWRDINLKGYMKLAKHFDKRNTGFLDIGEFISVIQAKFQVKELLANCKS